MKQTITRLEIIDHTKPLEKGGGRSFVKWENKKFDVEISLQDEEKTLKIFITKHERLAQKTH